MLTGAREPAWGAGPGQSTFYGPPPAGLAPDWPLAPWSREGQLANVPHHGLPPDWPHPWSPLIAIMDGPQPPTCCSPSPGWSCPLPWLVLPPWDLITSISPWPFSQLLTSDRPPPRHPPSYQRRGWPATTHSPFPQPPLPQSPPFTPIGIG